MITACSSYLHCDWKTEKQLEQTDKRIAMKIRNFKRKQDSQNFAEVDDGEYFNPDYVECERVLDVSLVPDPEGSGEQLTYYLVKWRALPYEDATWELEPDVDKSKIAEFYKWRDPPDDDEQVVFERPNTDEMGLGKTVQSIAFLTVNISILLQQFCVMYVVLFLKEIYKYGLYKFHVLVTTFETIIADCEILSQIEWRACVIDEAH